MTRYRRKLKEGGGKRREKGENMGERNNGKGGGEGRRSE